MNELTKYSNVSLIVKDITSSEYVYDNSLSS